jgi:methionyl-tRNA synthetase
MKEKINFETFLAIEKQLEIKLGTIQAVEKMPKSDKMLKLTVFFSEGDERTVMTNIGNRLENVNDLMYITLPFITNLEPAKIMGVESTAMIMVPTIGEKIDLKGSSGSNLM